jgi:hypothetical protein
MLALGLGVVLLRRGVHRVQGAPGIEAVLIKKAGDALTNEDLARLVQAHISSTVMLRLIDGRPHRFRIDSDSLVRLKKDGVSDEVILAVVAVTVGKADNPSTAPAGSDGSVVASQASVH